MHGKYNIRNRRTYDEYIDTDIYCGRTSFPASEGLAQARPSYLGFRFARFLRYSFVTEDLITLKALASDQDSSEGKPAHSALLHNLTVRFILQ